MPHCPLASMGTAFFILFFKFSYDKYSLDKVWTKIYAQFYFRGITLNQRLIAAHSGPLDKQNTTWSSRWIDHKVAFLYRISSTDQC